MKLLKFPLLSLLFLLLFSCSTPDKDRVQIALKGMPKDFHEAIVIERLRYDLIKDDFTIRGKRSKEIAKDRLNRLEEEYETLKNMSRLSPRYRTAEQSFVLTANQCKTAVDGFYEMNEGLPMQLGAMSAFVILVFGGLLFFILRKKKSA